MSDTTHAKGRCLCGAIGIETEAASIHLAACHCGMCRKWGGGPFLSISCKDTSFEGKDGISVFESSSWAERGFCKTCGTHLFYRAKGTEEYYVPVGVFDDIPGITFDEQIFIDRKPDYYDFANRTKTMTEAEVMELFAGPGT